MRETRLAKPDKANKYTAGRRNSEKHCNRNVATSHILGGGVMRTRPAGNVIRQAGGRPSI